jgi:putative ABC transport system permease protein
VSEGLQPARDRVDAGETEMLRNYLKTAWNVLQRRRFFTAVSLFGIALTLGVLTLVAALFEHTFAVTPPETQMDRTLGIYFAEMSGEHMRRNGSAGFGLIDKYARDLPGVERVALASMPARVSSFVNGAKVQSFLRRTDAEYWQVLAFPFLEGGPYSAAEVARGNRVAVINATTRVRFFGGAPAVGRTIEADGQTFTVAGVVEDVPMLRLMAFSDIWVPHSTAKSDSYRTELVGDFVGMLLLAPGADVKAVQDEFASRLTTVQFPDPKNFNTLHATPETMFDTVGRILFGGRGEGDYGTRLRLALIAGTLLFMLLPAINLVNLNVSRILERASEIGVRKAFGASSWTLVGQFLVENLLLTVLGAALGVILAAAGLALINASGLLPYVVLSVNVRVLAWGMLLAAVFTVVSGVYPAWRMSRLHPVEALRGGIR